MAKSDDKQINVVTMNKKPASLLMTRVLACFVTCYAAVRQAIILVITMFGVEIFDIDKGVDVKFFDIDVEGSGFDAVKDLA